MKCATGGGTEISGESINKSADIHKNTKEKKTTDGEREPYSINIFRLKTSNNTVKPRLVAHINPSKDFKIQDIVNHLDAVIADTRARVSVPYVY